MILSYLYILILTFNSSNENLLGSKLITLQFNSLINKSEKFPTFAPISIHTLYQIFSNSL